MKKISEFLKFILSWMPAGDPDAYGLRKYRAEKDRYRKYS